jgi:hypothetical protein
LEDTNMGYSVYERAVNAAKYCRENAIPEGEALQSVQDALDYNYPMGRNTPGELAGRIWREGA